MLNILLHSVSFLDPASKLGCVAVPGDTGYCVKLYVTKLSWPDQVAACQADNMRLASLTKDVRVNFVRNYLFAIGMVSRTDCLANHADFNFVYYIFYGLFSR